MYTGTSTVCFMLLHPESKITIAVISKKRQKVK